MGSRDFRSVAFRVVHPNFSIWMPPSICKASNRSATIFHLYFIEAVNTVCFGWEWQRKGQRERTGSERWMDSLELGKAVLSWARLCWTLLGTVFGFRWRLIGCSNSPPPPHPVPHPPGYLHPSPRVEVRREKVGLEQHLNPARMLWLTKLRVEPERRNSPRRVETSAASSTEKQPTLGRAKVPDRTHVAYTQS